MKFIIVTDNKDKNLLDLDKRFPSTEIIITESIIDIDTKKEDYIIFLKRDRFDILGNKYLFLTENETVSENYFIMKSFRDFSTNIEKTILLLNLLTK